MANLVGAFAASHGPLIVREWENVPAEQKNRMAEGFREVGRRIVAAKIDVLVAVSPDHWSNFFLNNVPTICVGVGEMNEGPPEPWMKAFPHQGEIAGHAGLGMHIVQTALREGFEPSFSHRLKMDHGICIPLWRMELEKLPRIVPVFLNSIETPMPTLKRCYQWGKLLRQAIDSYREPLRVGILGTGGLSHSIGEKTMGAVYEDFDRETLRRFDGAPEDLIAYLDEKLPTHGNGSEEVRNWLVAHGACGGRGFELVDYIPARKVIVGCGFASWRI